MVIGAIHKHASAMPDPDRQSLRRALKRINTILRNDWNPIGFPVPEDEYESYAPPILRMLLNHADKAALTAYLYTTAADTIGCPIPHDHAAQVAQQLLDLDIP